MLDCAKNPRAKGDSLVPVCDLRMTDNTALERSSGARGIGDTGIYSGGRVSDGAGRGRGAAGVFAAVAGITARKRKWLRLSADYQKREVGGSSCRSCAKKSARRQCALKSTLGTLRAGTDERVFAALNAGGVGFWRNEGCCGDLGRGGNSDAGGQTVHGVHAVFEGVEGENDSRAAAAIEENDEGILRSIKSDG